MVMQSLVFAGLRLALLDIADQAAWLSLPEHTPAIWKMGRRRGPWVGFLPLVAAHNTSASS